MNAMQAAQVATGGLPSMAGTYAQMAQTPGGHPLLRAVTGDNAASVASVLGVTAVLATAAAANSGEGSLFRSLWTIFKSGKSSLGAGTRAIGSRVEARGNSSSAPSSQKPSKATKKSSTENSSPNNVSASVDGMSSGASESAVVTAAGTAATALTVAEKAATAATNAMKLVGAAADTTEQVARATKTVVETGETAAKVGAAAGLGYYVYNLVFNTKFNLRSFFKPTLIGVGSAGVLGLSYVGVSAISTLSAATLTVAAPVAGAAAGVLLLVATTFAFIKNYQVSRREKQITDLKKQLETLQREKRAFEEEKKSAQDLSVRATAVANCLRNEAEQSRKRKDQLSEQVGQLRKRVERLERFEDEVQVILGEEEEPAFPQVPCPAAEQEASKIFGSVQVQLGEGLAKFDAANSHKPLVPLQRTYTGGGGLLAIARRAVVTSASSRFPLGAGEA